MFAFFFALMDHIRLFHSALSIVKFLFPGNDAAKTENFFVSIFIEYHQN